MPTSSTKSKTKTSTTTTTTNKNKSKTAASKTASKSTSKTTSKSTASGTTTSKSKSKTTRKTTRKTTSKTASKSSRSGGSPSSNAVMHAYNHAGPKCGGATPPPIDVVGRGAPINVGMPTMPDVAARDWFAAAPTQHAMAAEPMHTMNFIDRGVVFPNVPVYDNPKVFGGCWAKKSGGGRAQKSARGTTAKRGAHARREKKSR